MAHAAKPTAKTVDTHYYYSTGPSGTNTTKWKQTAMTIFTCHGQSDFWPAARPLPLAPAAGQARGHTRASSASASFVTSPSAARLLLGLLYEYFRSPRTVLLLQPATFVAQVQL